MVQLQIFTKSYYLQKIIAFIILVTKCNKILRKNISFFWIQQKCNFKIVIFFSGRLLIGQNDSLNVLYQTIFSCNLDRIEMT